MSAARTNQVRTVASTARLIVAAAFCSLGLATPVAAHSAASASPESTRNVLDIRAVGMRFEGPNEIPSGWVTLHFKNLSGMIHFDTGLDAVARWMDWRDPVGFESPAPAIFVGGVNDMPAGATTYFSVDLEPGDYALIAEVPDPQQHRLLLPFTVE